MGSTTRSSRTGTERTASIGLEKSVNRKRHHHYVWQRYLKSWSSNGKVWCRRGGKIFDTAPRNVAQERDFYKVRPHHPADRRLILSMAATATDPGLRQANIAWATDLLMLSEFAGYLESATDLSAEARDAGLKIASNAVEDMYAGAENEFLPFLEAMCEGNLSFAEGDGPNLPRFFHFISQQQGRTKHVEERVVHSLSSMEPVAGLKVKDPRSVISILRHVFANNVGGYLYLMRKELRFTLYRAIGGARFLATDQPVINLDATQDDFTPPESLDLFYPVSPVYALRIFPAGRPSGIFNESIDDANVGDFNRRLIEKSRDFVISSSRQQLETIEDALS